MSFNVGDLVKVLPPFDFVFPETYTIEYIKEDGTCGICGDRDFDPKYLQLVTP